MTSIENNEYEIRRIVRELEAQVELLSELTNYERINNVIHYLASKNTARRVLDPSKNTAGYGPRK